MQNQCLVLLLDTFHAMSLVLIRIGHVLIEYDTSVQKIAKQIDFEPFKWKDIPKQKCYFWTAGKTIHTSLNVICMQVVY